jgi:hypothetical protein
MGSGRDKKKKAKEKKGEVSHGRGERKLAHKAELAQSKQQRRAQRAAQGGDEDDLDALLAQVALQDAADAARRSADAVVERGVAPPSARVHATWLARGQDILLYGGECVEPVSGKVRVFGDLYVYHTQTDKWDRILPPLPTPPPRCAHASWLHRSCLYVLGGEFSSPNQERFRHYRDLWRLDLTTWRWDQLPTKGGGPSARSGHRAFVHGGSGEQAAAYVFGGFHDTGRSDEVRYYSDLWRLDLETLTWTSLGDAGSHLGGGGGGWGGAAFPSSSSSWPGARSGCQIVVCGDVALMHGGYRKSRDDDDEELEHGCALEDTWVLDLKRAAALAGGGGTAEVPAAGGAGAAAGGKKGGGGGKKSAAAGEQGSTATASSQSTTPIGPLWERVRKQGMAPGPRASFAMQGPVRGRVFLFGGVADRERRGGEDLASEFFNDLYGFLVEKRRWFVAEVAMPPSSAGGKKGGGDGGDKAAAVVASEAAAAKAAGDAAAAAAAETGEGGSTSSAPLPPGISPEAAQRFAAAKADPNHPLNKAAARIQALYRGHVVRKALRVYRLGGAVSEILYSPAAFTLDFKSARGPRPRARINAMAALVGGVAMWVLGGTVEVGSGEEREVTLDDLWTLNLSRLDGWRLVRANTAGEEAFRGGNGGSGSEWEEASDEDEDDEEEESG